MMRKLLLLVCVVLPIAAVHAAVKQAEGDKVTLDSIHFLGSLHLDKQRLEAVKKAVEEALNAPIDERESCGDDPLGCYARTAYMWNENGVEYREVIVYIHGTGNAGYTFHQINGKWPEIVIK